MTRLLMLATAIFLSPIFLSPIFLSLSPSANAADAYRWVEGHSNAGFGDDCYVLLCRPDDPSERPMAGLCRLDSGETCFIVPAFMYLDECKKLSPREYVRRHGDALAQFQCQNEN